MDDARLLDAVLDLAALASRTALPMSKVTVPTLGFGMRPRGPRTRPSLPTAPIMSGVAIDAIEVHEAFGHLRHHVVAAGEVGAGLLGLALLVALGEHEHAHRLTGAVREDERAADHLVGVLGIDSQANGEVDRLVELGELRLLDERARLFDRVFASAVDCFVDLRRGSWTASATCLLFGLSRRSLPPGTREHAGGGSRGSHDDGRTIRCHEDFGLRPCERSLDSAHERVASLATASSAQSTTSMPIERAVPRTVRIAASMSVQFMSWIFCAASSRTCFSVTLPTLFLFGSFEPEPGFLLCEARGLLEKHADRRRLEDEREGAVRVDRDHHGDDHVPALRSWR